MKDEYWIHIRRLVQWTVFALAGCVLGWAYTPYPKVFAGLILGMTFALLGAIFTAWKIQKVGEMAIQYKGQKKQASLGMPTRLGLVALSTLIALRYPEYFHIAAMVAGLMIPTVVAFLDMLYFSLMEKDHNADEGGE